jgi:hypothetical protein
MDDIQPDTQPETHNYTVVSLCGQIVLLQYYILINQLFVD